MHAARWRACSARHWSNSRTVRPLFLTAHQRLSVAAALPPQPMALSAAAVVGAAGVGVAAWLEARRKAGRPELTYDPTCKFTTSVLSRCPTLRSTYYPVPFFTDAHVREHRPSAACVVAPVRPMVHLLAFWPASDSADNGGQHC